MTKDFVVGVDIGGQSVKIGLVDRLGAISKRKTFSSLTFKEDDTENFLNALCDNILEVTSEVGLESVQGVGIGAPDGNYYSGTIEDAVNLPWAKGKVVPLRDFISKRLGLPVTVTNDANAAAEGEMIYGNAKGMKNFIEITIGTGVGSGIVIDGKVVYGHDGFAGELGHTTVVRHGGRLCGCGKSGCLEAYASTVGICRTAREMLDMVETPSILRTIDNFSSRDIYDAAVKGDLIAINTFAFTGKKLGEMFADFIAFSAPEAIILFGGGAKAGKFVMEPCLQAMEENVVHLWKGKVKLLPSGLPESDAAILGAGALAW